MSDVRNIAARLLAVLEREAAILPASDYHKALRKALAQQADPLCHWYQDGDSESNTWAAGCGRHRYFTLNEGTPTENDMMHCCYCGKQLVEVPIEDASDE